ncbi:MAG TPA: molybdopterin molybdotransferase MoeA [Candidatus Angelobacter sp.]
MSAAPQSAGVLSFEQARETVLKHCRQIPRPPSEDVTLLQALGRVLAGPVKADRNFPPFPRATRDGYAVRAADLSSVPATLRVVGQIKAGASIDRAVKAGEAAEIMTGAAVPEGADAVVMVEYTSAKNTAGRSEIEIQVEVQRAVSAGENIVPVGAEARVGQEILPRGMRLGPAQIAMAAGAGQARIKVYRRPHVAILATGDELVEVSKTPGPFQIRNSNSFSLAAQVTAASAEAMRLPVAPDEPRKLATLIHAGLAADMLLITGGVSMGKFDLVEAVLKKLGAEFFFTGAMIQPGRPVVFGQIELSGLSNGSGKVRRPSDPGPIEEGNALPGRRMIPFFGLPGNPISAMVCFDLFARPVLDALSGAAPARLPVAKARLRKAVKTKTGLTRFLPAVVSSTNQLPANQEGGIFEPEVEVLAWQGSGDLLASAQANCYLVVPPDRDSMAAGEMVSIVMR